MSIIAVIARDTLVAAIWFIAMLGSMVAFTHLLGGSYAAMDLGASARTVSTMSLAILAASAVAVPAWRTVSRMAARQDQRRRI